MKKYIMIVFIAFHLISNNLYAVNSYAKQHNVDFDTHESSSHHNKYKHEHFHNHSKSKHSHNHGHSQKTINILDFFVQLDNTELSINSYLEESYLETKYFIPNPLLKAPYRPPIV